ncbi:MAG: DUF3367 domain-containing protein [Chloroflexi bacterium]|nr:DUF3367 domain-containing protein [Chloroflexota bacterium]
MSAESNVVARRTPRMRFPFPRPSSQQYLGHAATYLLLVVAVVVVAIPAFYRPGFIAAGDAWPSYFLPYDHHFQDSLSLWGTTVSAIGSPQFEKDFTVYGAFGKALLALGLSGPAAEFFFYVLCLLCEALGTAYFALTLFPRWHFAAFAASMGVVLSLFNIISFLGASELFATGYYAFIAGFVLRKVQRNDQPLLIAAQTALLSLGLMVLSGNPPLAVCAVIWGLFWVAVAFWMFGIHKGVVTGFALGAFLALLANSWWLYAAYITLYKSGGAVQQTFAGPAAWAWVDARASFVNLLSLSGLWAWPQLSYFPWASSYLHLPLNIALFFPALFAIIALAKREKATFPLLIVVVVALFIAKGYHEPAAQINTFFYEHVPFFWLLRDPQVEANIGLYLALFVLAGLGIETVVRFLQNGSLSAILRIVGVVFICLDGYAFVSGQFIPNSWLNSQAHEVVTIPSYWYDLARFLNTQQHAGPALVLPNDDFYQMPYTWGFYGTDSVAQSFLQSPVFILTAPDTSAGYIGAGKAYNTFQNQLYQMIAHNERTPIAPLLRSLGIHWIVERQDINWRMSGRHILSATHITAYLSRQPGIAKAATFGKLDLYEVDNAPGIVSVYGERSQPKPQEVNTPAQPCTSGLQSLPDTVAGRQHLVCLTTGGALVDSAVRDVPVPSGASLLVLRCRSHTSWAIFLGGQKMIWKHEAISGFLNGWIVPPHVGTYHVDLVYLPALTFNRLRWLSLVTTFLCIALCCAAVVRRLSCHLAAVWREGQKIPAGAEHAGSSGQRS